jgi:hypothetical protein
MFFDGLTALKAIRPDDTVVIATEHELARALDLEHRIRPGDLRPSLHEYTDQARRHSEHWQQLLLGLSSWHWDVILNGLARTAGGSPSSFPSSEVEALYQRLAGASPAERGWGRLCLCQVCATATSYGDAVAAVDGSGYVCPQCQPPDDSR